MLKKTGVRPTYTNPTTLRSDARNCKEEARAHGLEGPPGRCFPIYRAFPPVPPGACQTRRGLGERRLESKSIRAGARAPRSARTRQRGASDARRRGGTRRRRPRPAGGAVRGPRRLPLRTAQSCSRAMFPSGPALREGPRRRRGGGGAALTARRGGSPARSPSPATRLPPRGAGLRSCNPPCPSPAAGSRAPRRAPPPAPRRSVPSTAPEPRCAGASDDTRTGRSSCGRGASPSEVPGAGSPGSFKQGARAPRAGRAACAHVPAPRPHPRAPRTLPANRQAGPPAASRPGRAARPRPLGWGRGDEVRGAAVSTPSAANGRERPLREAGAEGEPGPSPAAAGRPG